MAERAVEFLLPVFLVVALPGFLEEMFEVMTFYRPVRTLVEEDMKISASLGKLLGVFVLFAAVISVVAAVASYPAILVSTGTFTAWLVAKLSFFPLLFACIFAYVLVGSAGAFLFSRLFSSKGSLERLLGVNYFLAAAASIFALLFFIPFSQFAGLLLLSLGAVLYLYFLNETFSAMFGLSHAKSILALLVYLIAPPLLLFGVVWLIGALQIPLPFKVWQ